MKIPVLTLDVPNKNGNLYPKAVVEKALKKYIDEQVVHGRAMIVNRLPLDSTINLKDVIGIVKNVSVEGNAVMIEAEFLPGLPEALETKAGVSSGQLHLRTSGIGSIKKDEHGNNVVQPDYQITSCFVTDNPA